MGLFWALLQHCWRAHCCLRPPFITFHYISILAPFLLDLLDYWDTVFGPFYELKTILFWHPLHVLLRVFYYLRHPLYTLCYISLFGPILHSILSIIVFCFGSIHLLYSAIFLAPLQLCWRKLLCLRPAAVTCFFISHLGPFLHASLVSFMFIVWPCF